jgi:hypothetical protein
MLEEGRERKGWHRKRQLKGSSIRRQNRENPFTACPETVPTFIFVSVDENFHDLPIGIE